ncbi:MAG: hypothetical protein AB9880_01315 [Christensenellales bacterium]
MRKLLRFQLKRQLPLTLFFGLLAAALSVGAVLLYDEGTLQAFSEARAAAPFLFAMLGVQGSATLTEHLSSLLYGFLLPILGSLYAIALSSRLVADKVETGEMSYYLALPVRRSGFALTQFMALVLGLLALAVFAVLAGTAAGEVFAAGRLHLAWYLELNAGLFLAWTMAGGLAFLVSCAVDELRRASRLSAFVLVLFFCLSLAARPREMPGFLRYLSFWSLFDYAGLALGRLEVWNLLMPLVTAIFVLAGLRVFSTRELPL